MAVTFNPKLTDAGKAAAINAAANGMQLAITHVALGTGQYDSAAVGAGMTALAARKEAILPGSGSVTGAGGFRLNARFLPYEGTPYNATEVGFFAGDPAAGGVLFAVYSHPSDVIVQRNGLFYLAQYAFQIADVPSGSITISMDPDAAAWMGMLTLHENASNPHPIYVKKAGDTSSGRQLGVTEPQHADGKAFATTEFVKRSGHVLPSTGGVPITGASVTVTNAVLGGWADIQTAGGAVVLPLASACPVGGELVVRCSALSGLIVAQGSDVLNAPVIGVGTSVQIFQGETVTVTRNANGVWEVLGVGFRMPAGIVSYFAGASVPPGWLKLNGALLTRASYPALWQFAQSQGVVSESDWAAGGLSGRFSSGTTGSNFRLPDARGTFLRSLDDGRGIDPSRPWGSYQDHANRSHNHTVYDPGHAHSVYDPGHAHGAYTDAQGQHEHSNSHGNGFAYTGNEGFGNNGTAQGMPPLGAGFGNAWSSAGNTAAAGSHGHNVTVNGAGSNIGIYGAATGIQIQADGSEARPKNLALVLAVKF